MLHPFLLAIVASMAYGTNSVIAKYALDNMRLYMYVFIISMVYLVVAITLLSVKGKEIISYMKVKSHRHFLLVAVAAVLIGTLFGDTLTWSAFQAAPTQKIPIVSALVNLAPVFSLILVSIVFGVRLNAISIVGFILIVMGCITLSYAQA